MEFMDALNQKEYEVFYKHSLKAQTFYKYFIIYSYCCIAFLCGLVISMTLGSVAGSIIFLMPLIAEILLYINIKKIVEYIAKKEINLKFNDIDFYNKFISEGEEFKLYAEAVKDSVKQTKTNEPIEKVVQTNEKIGYGPLFYAIILVSSLFIFYFIAINTGIYIYILLYLIAPLFYKLLIEKKPVKHYFVWPLINSVVCFLIILLMQLSLVEEGYYVNPSVNVGSAFFWGLVNMFILSSVPIKNHKNKT